MYWTFEYTEKTTSGENTQEVNMAVIGTEVVTNLTGAQQMTYKVREDHSSNPDGRYYSWYNSM